jgi:hypothetical protein
MRDVDSEKAVSGESLDLDVSSRQRMRSVVDAVLKDCRESSIDGEDKAPFPSRCEAGAPWPTHRGYLARFWGEVPQYVAVRVRRPKADRASQSGEPIRSYSRASVISTVANSLAGSSSSTITVPSTSGASL